MMSHTNFDANGLHPQSNFLLQKYMIPNITRPALAACAAFTACARLLAGPIPGESRVAASAVVWNSPSANSLGSMPIGNGDIAANVWVDPTGDLLLLLSKSDSYDEFNRLLKLGQIRIRTTPALVRQGQPFQQALRMNDGSIAIKGGDTQLRVWVDANHPVVQIDLQSPTQLAVEVILENWRTAPRLLDRKAGQEQESHSAAYNRPEKNRVNPDVILPHAAAEIAWCHHNHESQWRANLELTGLASEIANGSDPILNRAFGAVVRAKGMTAVSDTVLKSTQSATDFSVRIFPLTHFATSPELWRTAAQASADKVTADTPARFAAHQAWWREFWNRSWIDISSADPKEADTARRVTRAYDLQRFVTACAGRGALPIKFNGSLFTVNQVFDADYRRWGGAYWWQNTRLPYWSMLYSGDYDLMRPLFQMYKDALPLRQAATRKYYGHDGAFYPETLYFWGNYTDGNYGLNRAGKPDGLTDNTFIRLYWQGGMELVGMALDYYDATRDSAFREDILLPLAKNILRFFDQHWQRGPDGKILYSPAMSLETWHVATNPTPEIAGLRFLLPRLLDLPVDDATKAEWRKQLADQPAIPTLAADGETRILPAETFSKLSNVENPELYAVFPYRSHTVAQGGEALTTGIQTWKHRRNRANDGWQQQPIQAALLGLTAEAKSLVTQRIKSPAAGYRFPGFYGPNYDWTPDQDQISVFVIGLQRMVMQCEDGKILLLPAWPREWNAAFKLHAPQQTTIEGEVRDGKVVTLKVTPESRRKDVVMPAPASNQPVEK